MKLAVLCPSEIAYRRFMPALAQVPSFEFVGLGVATSQESCVGVPRATPEGKDEWVAAQFDKANDFVRDYGGKVYGSYEELLSDRAIEAVYIPLPPALHYPWAKKALESGKHVLLEKPFTMSADTTQELLDLARKQGLAVHENYMFAFHSQIEYVREVLAKGVLGEQRLIRIDFGFPFRGGNDFRYSKALGGGALLDAGGYAIKLANLLLGPSARITTAQLSDGRDLEVDLFGSASLANDAGQVAQVSWGMDNDYRCNIDVWGSTGTLLSGRILTAPAGFEPTFTIRRNGAEEVVTLPADDSFRKSIEHFAGCIANADVREARMHEIYHQAELVDAVRSFA